MTASDELITEIENDIFVKDIGGHHKFHVIALIARIRQQEATIKRMDEALGTIERNTCCDTCHEASLVACAARK